MRLEDFKYINSLSDQEIVQAILNKDARITRLYMYEKCYPLFKSCFDKFYTDCENCIELINDTYLHIMLPSEETGKIPLANFGFRCSLAMWLKIIVVNRCTQLYKRKIDIVEMEKLPDGDRINVETLSLTSKELSSRADVHTLLKLMPNQRYRELIRYRYVDGRSNEETAELLGMSMDNYYNKHRLAKQQWQAVLRKEGLI